MQVVPVALVAQVVLVRPAAPRTTVVRGVPSPAGRAQIPNASWNRARTSSSVPTPSMNFTDPPFD